MKNIQRVLLEYIEEETNVEENFETLANIIQNEKILKDKPELTELLHLINNISNNHHRTTNFFDKVEQIFQHLKTDCIQYFSCSEIFEFFKDNKRLLLFLIEENIIIVDEYIVSLITNNKNIEYKYPEYFSPEIKRFLTKEFIAKYCENNSCLKNDDFISEISKEHQNDFDEKRKKGENDNHICELIRSDQIKDFIDHVDKTNISLDSYIQDSIFETNPLFMGNDRKIKIIEYAAFYGSIEIIKHMHNNGVELTSDIWIYAMHSKNAELIEYLENNKVMPLENEYEKILRESIKCHHNDVSNYLIKNMIKEDELQYNIENKFNENIYRYGFEYHNYCFFPNDIKYKFFFYYSCEFGYYKLVKLYLENMNIDINEVVIIIINVLNQIHQLK